MYETLVWSVHIYVVGYYMTTKESLTLTSCVFRERKNQTDGTVRQSLGEREREEDHRETVGTVWGHFPL